MKNKKKNTIEFHYSIGNIRFIFTQENLQVEIHQSGLELGYFLSKDNILDLHQSLCDYIEEIE